MRLEDLGSHPSSCLEWGHDGCGFSSHLGALRQPRDGEGRMEDMQAEYNV